MKSGHSRLLIPKKMINMNFFILTVLSFALFAVCQFFLLKDVPLFISIFIFILLFFPSLGNIYDCVFYIKFLVIGHKIADYNLECGKSGHYPAVAFIIPSYHEPFEVARMTFDSIRDIDYKGKKEIIVVDNSRDTDHNDFIFWKNYVESYNSNNDFENISTKFIYNDKKEGLKPGNMDEGQKFVEDAEFVAILDVDSTLPLRKNLIDKSIAEFTADEKLGYIQYQMVATNHYFNQLTQAISVSQNFLRLKRHASSYGGFSFFLGHNGIWKRSLLDKTGPWLEYYRGNIMITEDILKTLYVYENGHYGKSMAVRTGEWIPSSLNALESMWMRWTYGGIQVLWKYFRKIFIFRNFKLSEKVDEIHHFISIWMNALLYPVSIILLIFLPQLNLNALMLLLYFIPAFIRMYISYRYSDKDLNAPLIIKIYYLYAGFFIIDSFIFFVIMRSVCNFLLGKPQGWKITAKAVEEVPSWFSIILARLPIILLSILIIIIVIIKWIVIYKYNPVALFNYFPIMFISFNLLLCIILYGREGRTKSNLAEHATVECKMN